MRRFICSFLASLALLSFSVTLSAKPLSSLQTPAHTQNDGPEPIPPIA
jgi:hypothetical protein